MILPCNLLISNPESLLSGISDTCRHDIKANFAIPQNSHQPESIKMEEGEIGSLFTRHACVCNPKKHLGIKPCYALFYPKG